MQISGLVGVMTRFFSVRTIIESLIGLLLAMPALGADQCEVPVEIPQRVLDRQIVIFGELHGTRETAEFTGEYGCLLAQDQAEVILALEIPEREQSAISKYLGTLGSPDDMRSLLKGEFWNRPESRQDGRSSQAMARLIDRVRELRATGKRISIAAIDGQRAGLKRDDSMAMIVRDLIQAKPLARVIALVGNVHAFKDRGAFFDSSYESFAFLLADLNPLTLNIIPKQGSAWVCIERCGPSKITPYPWVAEREPGVFIGQSSGADPRYHGAVVLKWAEASPPARAQ